jgi:hypothetical protein
MIKSSMMGDGATVGAVQRSGTVKNAHTCFHRQGHTKIICTICMYTNSAERKL